MRLLSGRNSVTDVDLHAQLRSERCNFNADRSAASQPESP
jgi:hypothetical protein